MRLEASEEARRDVAQAQPPVAPVDPARLVARVRAAAPSLPRPLIAVLAVAGAAVSAAARREPTTLVAGPPAPAVPLDPTTVRISREQAMAVVAGMPLGRVDRVGAKLARIEAYRRTAQDAQQAAGTGPDDLVWVIAATGELRAPTGRPGVPAPAFTLGIVLVDPTDGTVDGLSLRTGGWPTWFDRLPDWSRHASARSASRPAGARAPSLGAGPGAAPCTGDPGPIATVVLHDDRVPEPRCAMVTGDQRLEVVNDTGEAVSVRFAHFEATLAPGESTMLDEPLAGHLEPGLHMLQALYGNLNAGPEIWLR